jgi:anti-anti-sigma factor
MSPAPFEVQSEILDGVQLIAVRGELDLDTVPRLEEALESALGADGPALLIDLSECEFIDSTGIALIVRAAQRLNHSEDGPRSDRFALCCVNDQVKRLLSITGLDSSIPLHGSREDAIADLRG